MLKKATYLVFFFVLSVITAIAQEDIPDTIKLSLNNPLGVVYTHLYYLQPDSYDAEKAASAINEEDPKKAEDLAVKLKQVLDGKGLYVDMGIIPQEANYTDSTTGKHRYILFEKYPEIYVEKVDEKWLYSRRTVDAIPALHKEVYPYGSNILVNLFGEFGQNRFLGLYAWQYLGMLIIAAITALLHLLFTWIAGLIIKQLIKSPKVPKDQRIVMQKAAGPISMMILTMILEQMVPTLQLPINLAKYVVLVLDVLTPVYGTLAVYRLTDLAGIYLWKQAEASETTLDDQLVPLVSKLLKIIVVIIGFFIVLSIVGVNVTALLAGLSIGGLALALAAQDTIKNLFGSLMIFLDRPFQIGDWVQANGVDGTVEEVGFRSTRVRTFANSLVTVPNGEIANMTVDNLGMRVYRRYKALISLTYDTPPDLIEKYVEGLRQIVVNHPATRKDYYEIHMNEMGATSLNILFYIFFDVPTWSEELKARHEIILETMRLAEKLNVRFAFPTQTLHIEEMPGQNSLTPQYKLDKAEMDKNIALFLEDYKKRYQD